MENINLENYFVPVAFSDQVSEGKMTKVSLHDEPYILVRTKYGIRIYHDYCPHRGVPLSLGKIVNGQIQCLYHGWTFDCEKGENTNVPVKNSKVNCNLFPAFAKEKYGVIWLSQIENAALPEMNENRINIHFSGTIHSQLANTLENFLEGSHTHYVHDGLIRTQNKKRSSIKARFIPMEDGFEVHYEAEKQKGLVTILTPKRFQQLTTVSKYIFPYTAILQYYDQNKKLVAEFKGLLKPETKKTTFFACIHINVGAFTPIASLIGKSLFKKIVSQDKLILEIQQKNLKLNYGKIFFSDDNTDLVGKQIFAWLHKRENILKEERNIELYL